MSAFFKSAFDLPAPIRRWPAPIPAIRVQEGTVEVSMPADPGGMASVIELTFWPHLSHCTWARSPSGQAVPFFMTMQGHIDPAVVVGSVAVGVLEYLALEAGRPDVADDFAAALEALHRASAGQDTTGEALADLAPRFPVWMKGVIVTGDEAALAHDLTRSALLPHLRDPAAHWRLWCDAYYALLSLEVRHGNPDRTTREALIALQTSVEAGCLNLCNWRDHDQYSYDPTVTGFSVQLHQSLGSLLLTRNSLLHRGRLELRVIRPGEDWSAARKRASADGKLDTSHMRDFAGAVAQALGELEAGLKVRARR